MDINGDMSQFLNLDTPLLQDAYPSLEQQVMDPATSPSFEAFKTDEAVPLPSADVGFDLLPLFPFDFSQQEAQTSDWVLPPPASAIPDEEPPESVAPWLVDPSVFSQREYISPDEDQASLAEEDEQDQDRSDAENCVVISTSSERMPKVTIRFRKREASPPPDTSPEGIDGSEQVDDTLVPVKQETRKPPAKKLASTNKNTAPGKKEKKPAKLAAPRKRRRIVAAAEPAPSPTDGTALEAVCPSTPTQVAPVKQETPSPVASPSSPSPSSPSTDTKPSTHLDKYALDRIGYGIDDLRRFVDELDNDTTISAKEKRQMRNKLSARNFRVRRKEYVTQLEDRLKTLGEENGELMKRNKELEELNKLLQSKLAEREGKEAESIAPNAISRPPSREASITASPLVIVSPKLAASPFHQLHPQHPVQVHNVHVPETARPHHQVTQQPQTSHTAADAFMKLVATMGKSDDNVEVDSEVEPPSTPPPSSPSLNQVQQPSPGRLAAHRALRSAYEALKLGGSASSSSARPATPDTEEDVYVRDILAVAVMAAQGMVSVV
ncbi:hypothetical protein HKX48_005375 [Thoreauomyces humboldtii]|nr:hypothetical protein HKX48_005375 [Thoreauomyces humboldtii]